MRNSKLQNQKLCFKNGKKIRSFDSSRPAKFHIFCSYLRIFRKKTSCMQCTHTHTHKHMEYISSYRCFKLVPCHQTPQSPSQKGSLKRFCCTALAHPGIIIIHRTIGWKRLLRSLSPTMNPALSSPPLNHVLSAISAHFLNTSRNGVSVISPRSLL